MSEVPLSLRPPESTIGHPPCTSANERETVSENERGNGSETERDRHFIQTRKERDPHLIPKRNLTTA